MAKAAEPRFKYRGQERSAETVIRRGQSAGRSYDSYISSDIPTIKIKEGENTLRILPQSDSPDWDLPVYIHYNVGPDEATYLCLDKMKQEPCPVCEARRKATTDDEADSLRISERRLAWVIDRDNEKAGPLLWSMPASLYKDICQRTIDKKTGKALLIDDPDEGYDLGFTREGTALRTKYTGVEVLREQTPIHDKQDIQDRWLDYIAENPLSEILNFYDAEYIEKVLYGQGRSEDEAPRRSRRGRAEPEETEETTTTPRTRRRVAAAEEEVEEETTRRGRRGAEPEEEVEETRPRRTRGKDAEETETGDDWPSERRTTRRGAATEEEPVEEETETRSTRFGRRGRNGKDAEVEEEETRHPRRGGGKEPEEAEERPSRLRGLRERRA